MGELWLLCDGAIARTLATNGELDPIEVFDYVVKNLPEDYIFGDLFDHFAHAGPHDGVVVGQEDVDLAHGGNYPNVGIAVRIGDGIL